MADPVSQDKLFELCIWHPLALPADKQNRTGYEILSGASWTYPPAVSRSERAQAIKAVRDFVDETSDLVAALPEGESDLRAVSNALHICLYLSPNAGSNIASAINQSAMRYGLAGYDPQADMLTLPPPYTSCETEKSLGASDKTTPTGEKGTTAILGPWTLLAFVRATRTYYTKITESGSDRCQCDNCKNFIQARDQAYPSEILTVFDSLGIDFRKESEVHYYGRTPAGLHTYRGWFYLAGSIEQGPDNWNRPTNERRFHRIDPGFKVGLSRKSDYGFSEWETVLIDAGFADGPCIEVDFYVDLPWLFDAPEPDGPRSEEK